jgi:hypothetical protein
VGIFAKYHIPAPKFNNFPISCPKKTLVQKKLPYNSNLKKEKKTYDFGPNKAGPKCIYSNRPGEGATFNIRPHTYN